MPAEDGEIYATCISRTHDTCTTPDLILATPDLGTRASSYAQDSLGSDHKGLLAIFPTDAPQNRPPKRNQKRKNWNFKKANWLYFSTVIENRMRSAPWTASISAQIRFFTQLLLQAAHIAIPRFPAFVTPSVHAPIIKRYRRLRQQAFRKYLVTRTDQHWVEYKRLRALALRETAKHRRNKWQRMVESLTLKGSGPTSAWRLLKGLSGRISRPQISPSAWELNEPPPTWRRPT